MTALQPGSPSSSPPADDVAAVQAFAQTAQSLYTEVGKAIVGQHAVLEQMLVAILARGHALLEGVPGLAKTLMVSSLANCLHLQFRRVQFTPDLMPSDITGTDVLTEDSATGQRAYSFIQGPVFTNILLADEINRTPPKTQAALLEAMQERHVTAGGKTYTLPRPFFVLATQNPLEQEGTYPLPEAQLDRFLLYIRVGYPSPAEEWDIALRVTSTPPASLSALLSADDLLAAQQLVSRMPVADQVVGYAWALVRASRPRQPEASEYTNKYVAWGAGPRGVIALITAAKARALLHGRYHATQADVQAMIGPALRHRVAPNYAALAAGINADALLAELGKHVPADRVYERPA